MKVAVITVAVIGAIAAVAVLFLAAIRLWPRGPSWTERYQGVSMMLHATEAQALHFSHASQPCIQVRAAYYLAMGGHGEVSEDYQRMFGLALSILDRKPISALADLLGTIAGNIAFQSRHGSEEACHFWNAALISVSAQALKRQAINEVDRVAANAIMARSLLMLWPADL